MTSYLSFEDIARELGVPVRTVYFLNQKGLGPKTLKVGRAFRVSQSDFDSWREGNSS